MLKPKQHIIVLTPGFAESETDSSTIPALLTYLRSLKKLNPDFSIKVISFQYPFKLKKYTWNNITVFPLNGRNSKLKKILIWKKAWVLLKKIHSEKPITCIHSFWLGECSIVGGFFAKKYKIKHIVTAMGQDVLNPNYYAKLLSQKNNKIITLSKRHQTHLKENHNIDSQIIHWGIDSSDFPNLQEKTIDILGVGSLITIKNYTLFIKLIDVLSKKRSPLKVELIGDGELKAEIEELIVKTQLQNNIIITGELPRDSVLEKMSKAKVLLHTSNYESFGYVFLEALFSGMHIISFEVGIAQNSLMWTVCKNPIDMIDGLLKVLSLNDNRNRELLYNIENTVLKYHKIYCE